MMTMKSRQNYSICNGDGHLSCLKLQSIIVTTVFDKSISHFRAKNTITPVNLAPLMVFFCKALVSYQ
jgi:hypothetical protein